MIALPVCAGPDPKGEAKGDSEREAQATSHTCGPEKETKEPPKRECRGRGLRNAAKQTQTNPKKAVKREPPKWQKKKKSLRHPGFPRGPRVHVL